jgi:hypothetical protein
VGSIKRKKRRDIIAKCQNLSIMSYHPYKIIGRACFLDIVRSVAERTIEMVLKVPPFEAFAVENVETFQVSNFLGAENRVEANNTADWISLGAIEGANSGYHIN